MPDAARNSISSCKLRRRLNCAAAPSVASQTFRIGNDGYNQTPIPIDPFAVLSKEQIEQVLSEAKGTE
jgi:hypothetical protein